VFSIVVMIGAFFGALSCYWSSQDKKCCGCMCSGFIAVVMLVVAIALIIFKVKLMEMAGPEPSGPAVQQSSTTEVVVDTKIPFDTKDINAPGPVKDAYMEGMQNALDRKSGAGAVTVVDVRATPSALLLLQQSSAASNRVSLVYTLSEEVSGNPRKRRVLPRPSASDLESYVQKAAKKHTGDDVPKALLDVASGSVSALADAAVEVKVETSFRCEARHEFNEDIRAAARIQMTKHKEIPRELKNFARGKVPDFGLRVAERCNEDSQAEAFQVCLGAETFWVDFTMQEPIEVPKSEASVESFLCDAACKLGKGLTAETTRVVKEVNSKLQGLELDDGVISDITCSPAFQEGRKCEESC